MDIKKFGFYFLLGIIMLVAFKFYAIIYDFFPSIAAGCVFAYLFNPVYKYFLKVTNRQSISAFIVIFIIITLILIPFTVIILALQKQINMLITDQTMARVIASLISIKDQILTRFNVNYSEYTNDILADIIPRVVSGTQNIITAVGPKIFISITRFILSAFVSIFLLFYLLKNSRFVIMTLKSYFPLSNENSDILLKEMGKDTKALIFGQLLIAIIQGSLGALGFLICGVPGFILWGIVMLIASFIPVLGASVIWLPAAIILLANGAYFSGIGLILWGMFIVGTVDNIIRPKLTGSLGKIHPVTVLLGVFIGLKEWGFFGIIIGPLIISVLLILIKMFREEYLTEESADQA